MFTAETRRRGVRLKNWNRKIGAFSPNAAAAQLPTWMFSAPPRLRGAGLSYRAPKSALRLSLAADSVRYAPQTLEFDVVSASSDSITSGTDAFRKTTFGASGRLGRVRNELPGRALGRRHHGDRRRADVPGNRTAGRGHCCPRYHLPAREPRKSARHRPHPRPRGPHR